MQKNRCIYCMEELTEENGVCPGCHRSFWEYGWQPRWLHPYTILKERYEIGAVLGESAYAVTYMAFDRVLGQRVAVKEFFPVRLAERTSKKGCQELAFGENTAEFLREKELFAEEAGRLFGHYEYRGMAAVTDLFHENQTDYLVTEYLPGVSLREYLEVQPGRRIPGTEAVEMLLPAMEALTLLHSIGLLHRGISAERLRMDENGGWRFTGLGSCFLRQKNDEKEGPWEETRDVCALLYEMLAGRKPDVSDGRFLSKKVRLISDTVPVEESLEAAVMQGLEPEARNGYFYMGALAERLGTDSSNIRPMLGSVRALWGERWLSLVMKEEKTGQKRRRFLFTVRQKKRFIKAAAGTLGAALLTAAGLGFYAETHPEKVLRYHLKQDRKYASAHPAEDFFAEQTKYKKAAEYLKKQKPDMENEEGSSYKIEKEQAQRLGLGSNIRNKFAIKRDTLLEALKLLLGEAGESVETGWNGAVRVRKGRLEMLLADCCETCKFRWTKDGEEVFISIVYDVSDKRAVKLKAEGNEVLCREIIREILPLLVPDSYLTEAEAETLCTAVRGEKRNYTVVNHGQYQLFLQRSERAFKGTDAWLLELTASDYFQQKMPEQRCAGNYARGSEEYEKFLDFLQKNGAVTEHPDGTKEYLLDERAARSWGQLSNEYLLDRTAEEFLERLKEQGLELCPEKEDGRFAVKDMGYGILQSEFFRRETWSLGESLRLRLVYDLISSRIWGIGIYSTAEDMKEVSGLAAVTAGIVSEDIEETTEELAEFYEKFWKENMDSVKKGGYWGFVYADCGYGTMSDMDGQYCAMLLTHPGCCPGAYPAEYQAPYRWTGAGIQGEE